MATPVSHQQLSDTLGSFYKQLVEEVERRVEASNNRLLAQIEARMNANLSTFKTDTVATIETKMGSLSIAPASGAKSGAAGAAAEAKTPRKGGRNANLWFADQIVADATFRGEYFAKYPQQANMTINDTKKNDEQRFKVIAKAIWDSMGETDKSDIKKLKEAKEKTAEGSAADAPSSAPLPSNLTAPPPVASFSAPAAAPAPAFAAPSFAAPTFAAPK